MRTVERVYETLGKGIRDGRETLGLEQAELAKLLGVGQQAVSAWERGQSRPRRTMLPQVAAVLGLAVGLLVDLGRYAVPAGLDAGQGGVAVPPLAPALPLGGLPPDRFEALIVELVQAMHPDAHVTRFGGPGEKQHGIDVLAAGDDGRNVATAQCKRHVRFGAAAVAEAVAAVTISAPRHYLFLSRQTASPGARSEIGKYPAWRLLDGEDISRFIRSSLPLDQAVRLVDTYFPGQREPFLGVQRPGPWLTAEDAFGLNASHIYTHDWELVGRADVLRETAMGLYEKTGNLIALSGRGGIGKTRLLRAIAESAPDATIQVRLFNGGQPVEPADFELLPMSQSLVVLIDDAHECEDLSAIVAGIWRRNHAASILVATRPYRWDSIRGELARSGLRPDSL